MGDTAKHDLKKAWQILFAELRNITTIDLMYNAATIFEKVLWGLIGVCGSMWAVYFISIQLREEHASILLQGDIKSTELKYPAISICSKITTKYAIAERLGNFIDPMNMPDELLSLRQDFFLRSLGIALPKSETNEFYKNYYWKNCIETTPMEGCQNAESIYFDAKLKGINIKDVYNGFVYDSSTWNMTLLATKHLLIYKDETLKNGTQQIPLNVTEEEDWKYVYNFIQIFDKWNYFQYLSEKMDWSTNAVGSFFIKNLKVFKYGNPNDRYGQWCANDDATKESIIKLNQFLTLTNQTISLPHIAHLYGSNDFRLQRFFYQHNEYRDHFENDSQFSESLKTCIEKFSPQNNEETDIIDGFTKYTTTNGFGISMVHASPCLNLSRYPECNDYCKWHHAYFMELPKSEFLTLMKFAMPQRKFNLGQALPKEKDIAKKLFGNYARNELENFLAPFPLILFCYSKEEGFILDDHGIFDNFCDEFFPTPTDQGICLTKNMDIKEVMHSKPSYDELFEPNLQESKQYVEQRHGTLGSENTLVFFTGSEAGKIIEEIDDHGRKDVHGEVMFKLHQDDEFAHLFEGNTFFKSPTLWMLQGGNEYFFDVIPRVVKTTEAFKKISLAQRGCRLQQEVQDNSIFKIYKMQNCKYECHVNQAQKLCKCIPWDYMHYDDTQEQECDLFGRTCFFDAMENLSKSSNCTHCENDCDHTTYDVVMTKTIPLLRPNYLANLYYIRKTFGGDPYPIYFKFAEQTKCTGQKIFCQFFDPINGTMIDRGLENAFFAISNYSFIKNYEYIAEDLVIVHLRIMEPEIKVIDKKYTMMDNFALFGGNFGIFVEITGCSFLVVLNFFILLFKLLFGSRCERKN